MALKMNAAELTAFLEQEFPQTASDFAIKDLNEASICVRLKVTEQHLRPGGTVSGPAMFALADVSFYLMVLANIGPQALSVTTNCSIDFMRKPELCDMTARARVLKLGRSLAVGDVLLYSGNLDIPVAHANLTYSIPSKNQHTK